MQFFSKWGSLPIRELIGSTLLELEISSNQVSQKWSEFQYGSLHLWQTPRIPAKCMHFMSQMLRHSLCSSRFPRFLVFPYALYVPANCEAATPAAKRWMSLSADITQGHSVAPTWLIWAYFLLVNYEIIVQDVENWTEKCTFLKVGGSCSQDLAWQTLTVVGWPEQSHVTNFETRSANAEGQMSQNYTQTLALACLFC